jgi:hypothetical protein
MRATCRAGASPLMRNTEVSGSLLASIFSEPSELISLLRRQIAQPGALRDRRAHGGGRSRSGAHARLLARFLVVAMQFRLISNLTWPRACVACSGRTWQLDARSAAWRSKRLTRVSGGGSNHSNCLQRLTHRLAWVRSQGARDSPAIAAAARAAPAATAAG